MLNVPTLWIVFVINFLALGLIWAYVTRSYPKLEAARFWTGSALTAAGVFQAVEQRADLVLLGVGPMVIGLVVAFVVAYATIAWLLRFVASNSLLPFVWYRVGLGVLLAVAVGAGWITAT